MVFGVKTKKVKEKKTPKTREVFVIKGNYGYGHGFEDETQETSYWGAKNRLKEYNENMPNVPHRIVRKRVPYFELSENERKQNFKEMEEYDKRVKVARLKRQQRNSPQVKTNTWLGSFKTE